MDVIRLTRTLIDIPSVTGEEGPAADFAAAWLEEAGFRVVRQEVTPGRTNLFASAGEPAGVVLCSHLDTVPPPFPSTEDETFVRGRGACDAKGPTAAMMTAGRTLLAEGFRRFGILLVVGEETDSDGARAAGELSDGCRFIVIGEPTQNRLALGHKGVFSLRLRTAGRAAHSAFPHLGKSAVEGLLDVLQDLRSIAWPVDPVLGVSTINIGKIGGGTADNVLASEAWATVMIRCSVPVAVVRDLVFRAAAGRAEIEVCLESSPVRFLQQPGYETTILPFGSDAPYLEGFGGRLMLGPGDPEDAHTAGEKVEKRALIEAAEIYRRLVHELDGETAGRKAAGR